MAIAKYRLKPKKTREICEHVAVLNELCPGLSGYSLGTEPIVKIRPHV